METSAKSFQPKQLEAASLKASKLQSFSLLPISPPSWPIHPSSPLLPLASVASPVPVTQAQCCCSVTLPLMEQLSFLNGYELLAHDHDRAQALEKHTFRRSGGSTTGFALPDTSGCSGVSVPYSCTWPFKLTIGQTVPSFARDHAC